MTYEAWHEEAALALLEPFTSDGTMVLVALQAVQDRFGFVPPEAIALIAGVCNVSRADVHGVLTFYHELRTTPPAQRRVRVCRAEACQAVGSHEIEAAFAHAGHPVDSHSESTSVEAVYCFGNCALGPNVEVDGVLRGHCTPAIVTEALR